MTALFVGVRHDDEAIRPTDVQHPSIPLVNRLEVIYPSGNIDLDSTVCWFGGFERLASLAGAMNRHANLLRDFLLPVERTKLERKRRGRGLAAREKRGRERCDRICAQCGGNDEHQTAPHGAFYSASIPWRVCAFDRVLS